MWNRPECLLATEVQALSSIAVNLKSQFSSIARPLTLDGAKVAKIL
ncbi:MULTISPECIES: hypothetical protein [unclassified Microcoleus]|nr:hypothetical protein [Microcoleus sp. PH2017_28_MFU_U_A]MCC3594999.1 hypothetical protein [Microcoleus sp. PH2017_28_MFU_U_A]